MGKQSDEVEEEVEIEPITLMDAVPRGGKNKGIDMTFASFDDYAEMIEADMRDNPPASAEANGEDDEDAEDGDDEEDLLDAALVSDGEDVDDEMEEKSPKMKKKGSTPPKRVTRAALAARARDEGVEEEGKRRASARSPSGVTPAKKRRR